MFTRNRNSYQIIMLSCNNDETIPTFEIPILDQGVGTFKLGVGGCGKELGYRRNPQRNLAYQKTQFSINQQGSLGPLLQLPQKARPETFATCHQKGSCQLASPIS